MSECGRKGWEKLGQFIPRGFHLIREVETSLPAVEQGGGSRAWSPKRKVKVLSIHSCWV